ncbi:hypothetical protein QDY67_00090 [Kingella negevensis]|nr:hypothetical protein [Kingella negevensis]MDK4687680.1 hypothetical protein [Kingella negevensis]WII91323.1 hypothetical protein QEO93_01640 [Kingella negevensis]
MLHFGTVEPVAQWCDVHRDIVAKVHRYLSVFHRLNTSYIGCKNSVVYGYAFRIFERNLSGKKGIFCVQSI